MTVTTTTGAKIFIGTTAPAPNLAAFEADTYVEVKEVENLGEFGDESALVNFAAIGDGRVRKLKGARDAGTMALIVGRDPLDAGQIALAAAEGTKFEYNFKVVAEDAPSGLYSDSVFYFRALVTSQRNNFGANDSVTRKTFNLAVNTGITEEESELI